VIRCDIGLCVGCRMCEVSCSAGHYVGVSSELSRIRVAKMEGSGIDLAIACLSCLEKPCLECPTLALSVGSRGEIVLEEDDCINCRACYEACPVGAVGYHDDLPLFCDLCGDGPPACVEVCPTGALSNTEDIEISLRAFMGFDGKPGQKRANYATIESEPIREGWASGVRVDG